MNTGASTRTLRRMASRVRPDRATILRSTPSTDGAGEAVDTWETVAEDVSCRIRPAGGAPGIGVERVAGDAIQDDTTHLIAFPAGQDIDEPDRVQVGDDVYDVTLVRRSGAQEVERLVEVKEVPS